MGKSSVRLIFLPIVIQKKKKIMTMREISICVSLGLCVRGPRDSKNTLIRSRRV